MQSEGKMLGRRSLIRAAAVTAVAALGLLAIACSPGTTEVTINQSPEGGISVSGEGSVTVAPDVAVISIGVEVTRETVEAARNEAAAANLAIRDALAENGVEERDIATAFFRISPQYNFEQRRNPEIVGFTVSNQLTVKVRNLDSVSEVLDDAIKAGGDLVRVNSISFTVDEPEQYFDEAREHAMADAKARAEQLASLAGVSLGAPRTISESRGGGGPVPVARFEAFAVDQAATVISPGESEIFISVFIVYDVE